MRGREVFSVLKPYSAGTSQVLKIQNRRVEIFVQTRLLFLRAAGTAKWKCVFVRFRGVHLVTVERERENAVIHAGQFRGEKPEPAHGWNFPSA